MHQWFLHRNKCNSRQSTRQCPWLFPRRSFLDYIQQWFHPSQSSHHQSSLVILWHFSMHSRVEIKQWVKFLLAMIFHYDNSYKNLPRTTDIYPRNSLRMPLNSKEHHNPKLYRIARAVKQPSRRHFLQDNLLAKLNVRLCLVSSKVQQHLQQC